MNARRALEKNGFRVEKDDNGWNISQFTPAGEDWNIYVAKLDDFITIAENFDPEEEFEIWFENRHKVAGVPPISELWKDQVWKQEILNKVLEDIG